MWNSLEGGELKRLGSRLAYDGPWNHGKIHIEAYTVSELTKVVSELRESAFLRNGTSDLESTTRGIDSDYPSIPASSNCTSAILALLDTDWGKHEGRTEAELTSAMKANAILYPHGTVSGLLISLTRRGALRRVGKKSGSWAYVLGQVETVTQ